MAPSPHDALFKETFGQPDIARSEFELVLPPAVVAHLDLSTLEVAHGHVQPVLVGDLQPDAWDRVARGPNHGGLRTRKDP
jgi:hypothetical protein